MLIQPQLLALELSLQLLLLVHIYLNTKAIEHLINSPGSKKDHFIWKGIRSDASSGKGSPLTRFFDLILAAIAKIMTICQAASSSDPHLRRLWRPARIPPVTVHQSPIKPLFQRVRIDTSFERRKTVHILRVFWGAQESFNVPLSIVNFLFVFISG